MKVEQQDIQSKGIKFVVRDNEKVVGHAYLYLFHNDLHDEPAGYIEDVYVDESYRGTGVGSQLINALLAKAKELGCYKIVGTSREDREKVHAWYERVGFKKYGYLGESFS